MFKKIQYFISSFHSGKKSKKEKWGKKETKLCKPVDSTETGSHMRK